MAKKFKKIAFSILFASLLCLGAVSSARASTTARQFQLDGGLGVFVGNKGVDANFDFSLEPEYFFTEHNTLSFRFDITAGHITTFQLGGRWRYYFDIPKHEKVNLYVGLGIGGVINVDGANFVDAALPVFGWQYDLGQHLKIGSDVSLDITFNSHNVGFASRLMPVVLKWAF